MERSELSQWKNQQFKIITVRTLFESAKRKIFSYENGIFISCIPVSPLRNRSYIQSFSIFFYKILYLIFIYLITYISQCREQFKVGNTEPDECLLMFCICLITLIESITPINVHTFYIKYFIHNTCTTCIHLIQIVKFW